jgi:RND family efflux transporter MFP subunit
MKNRRNLIILAIVLVVLFFGYRSFIAQSAKLPETAKVTHGDLVATLTISGKVAADQDAMLQFQAAGQLAWVGVKTGDYVRKGQVIAALDQRSVVKSMQKYLNTYQKTRDNFDQLHYDSRDEILTDTLRRTLEQAQMDLNSSVLDVEIQDLARQYASLWTPIEGFVVRADADYAGINIVPGVTAYEIVNPKSIYFSALADQSEVTQIRQGMNGRLVLDSYPDKELNGTVASVGFTPKAGESNTVYEVKFTISEPNADYRYRLGMTGDLTFETNRVNNTLYLPGKFVKSDNGKKYVMVFKNGQQRKTFVGTGLETDENIEITSGLTAGETVAYD